MITEKIFNAENITATSPQFAQLKALFPNCFSASGEFLWEKFQAEIASQTDISREFYQMNWLGKSYAKLLRNLPPETLLAEDLEHNAKPENADSQNLLIQGDNLEVLKHLKNAYSNSVKMIYIDPPYNTGSDGFVYQDDRKFTPEQLVNLANITQDEAERILNFTDRGSNSHSAWLTFMYPRLYIARELLKEDGVIFISIDDNEAAQLKLLCDEVFGEGNFEGHIHWRRRHNQPNDKTKMIGLVAEHILCYAKDSQKYKISGVGKLPLTGDFSNPDNDPRGDWASKPWKIGSDQSGSPYKIISPTGIVFDEEWMGEENTFKELLADNRIYFTKNGNGLPRKKYFKFEREEEGQCATNWWDHSKFGHNQLGNDELTELFGVKNTFSNPKNTVLLRAIFGIANCKNNDLILDFFAGSGTTADALMKFNIDNECYCRCISVQLPEDLDEALKTATSENKKTLKNAIEFLDSIGKPHNIFEITKERIIRSAVKIRQDFPNASGDFAFKIYQTTENFNAVSDDEFNPNQAELPNLTSLTESQIQTLLTTWRVYDGAKLTDPVQAVDLGGYTAYLCDKRLYLLNEHFDSPHLLAFIQKLDNDTAFNPNRVIVFGCHMASAMQQELNQALVSYSNRKNISLSLIVRN